MRDDPGLGANFAGRVITMVRISPRFPAIGRFSAWLLAGASVVGLSGTASGEPIQPFWLIPTVLADNGLQTQSLPKQTLTLWRPETRTSGDLNLFLKPEINLALWPHASLSGGSDQDGASYLPRSPLR